MLYGDGEPSWSNSINSATAMNERVKTCRFVVKHAFIKPGLKCIAEKLRYCSRNNRCYSAACPECGRALQRFFVSECKQVFAHQSVCVTSIIGRKLSIRDELSLFSAGGLINRVRSLLRRNGVALAVGGIDFSCNQDGIGTFESHWCAHFWLILPNRNRSLWEPALRSGVL